MSFRQCFEICDEVDRGLLGFGFTRFYGCFTKNPDLKAYNLNGEERVFLVKGWSGFHYGNEPGIRVTFHFSKQYSLKYENFLPEQILCQFKSYKPSYEFNGVPLSKLNCEEGYSRLKQIYVSVVSDLEMYLSRRGVERDLKKFSASIDASKPKILLEKYFFDYTKKENIFNAAFFDDPQKRLEHKEKYGY